MLLPEEVASAGLVKIDVNGAEYQMVEGMLNLLPRFPKDVRFLMELKPNILSIGQSSTKTGSLVASQNRFGSLGVSPK